MAMTTAEHVLVVGAAAGTALVAAPVLIPMGLAAVGATAVAAAIGGFTGVSLTGGGAALLAGWGTHKYLNASGAASK